MFPSDYLDGRKHSLPDSSLLWEGHELFEHPSFRASIGRAKEVPELRLGATVVLVHFPS